MAIHCGYVVASDGGVYLQLPADNRYGFVIADDDQTWDSPPFGGREFVGPCNPDRGRLLRCVGRDSLKVAASA